ncbi:cyclin-G1-like [Lineus longissimus]|uniref:cyclin-G1-like n=1 Tax=Lineus longissimus TaxID=88925 RepID=UPI002B4EF231
MGPVAAEIVEKMESFEDGFNSNLVGRVSCVRDVNKSLNLLSSAPTSSTQIVSSGLKYLEMLDRALSRAEGYRPIATTNSLRYEEANENKVTCQQRDDAITNLRCLHLFYGFSPETLALTANLLDRFLCKVKVRSKYLACITMACYFIAVKTIEEDQDIPYGAELVHLSQCGGTAADLLRMESIILDKLDWDLNIVTPLTFLDNFYAIFVEKFPQLSSTPLLEATTAKLEVCMCHFGFHRFQAPTVALALLSCGLQELKMKGLVDMLTAVVDMQAYCKVSDAEFLECRGMVIEFLVLYYGQKLKVPKQRMVWAISRRTMSQLKPSYYNVTDLPTIYEDADQKAHPSESADSGFESSSANAESDEDSEATTTLPEYKQENIPF